MSHPTCGLRWFPSCVYNSLAAMRFVGPSIAEPTLREAACNQFPISVTAGVHWHGRAHPLAQDHLDCEWMKTAPNLKVASQLAPHTHHTTASLTDAAAYLTAAATRPHSLDVHRRADTAACTKSTPKRHRPAHMPHNMYW